MRWRKLGRCQLPQHEVDWWVSHAAVPFAESVDEHHIRVWFSGRDTKSRSHVAWALVDLRDPECAVEVSREPVLSPGQIGLFDDSGTMASWITRHGEDRYLYYIGWNLGTTVPFRNAVGVAVSHKGEPFRRYADGPVLDRTMTEPHFVASCCVLLEDGVWRMWYLSCEGWDEHGERPRHRYLIRYAESSDGIVWQRDGTIAIGFEHPGEYAISRPSVIHDGDCWRMWYSWRGDVYRIGYAESEDGVVWQRKDHLAGIDMSESGWDSEMIEYPHVFDHGGERYMLYNGNDYGRTGFGLAILDRD